MTTYVWLKDEWGAPARDSVVLGNIVDFEPNDGTMAALAVPTHRLKNGLCYVAQRDVVRALQKRFPEKAFAILGAQRCWIGEREKKPQNAFLHVVLSGTAVVLIFAASFFTIMNFHADVGMTDVHDNLLSIFAGGRGDARLLVGIPYSVGVAAGALLFILPSGKRRGMPDPMEVQNAVYENDVKDYLRGGTEDVP